MSERFLNNKVELHCGDMTAVLPTLAENSIDSCVCDPPYGIKFMGRAWDCADNIAFQPDTWAQVYRALKPGAHLVAFSSTRTYHRMACAIEDAGFEIRDSLMWIYGSGFPKSHNVSKGIDKAAGAEREVTRVGQTKAEEFAGKLDLATSSARERRDAPATAAARQWQGWGTALKPAFEPIVLARKPLSEKTIAANVLRWRTGAINIDGCRVGGGEGRSGGTDGKANKATSALGGSWSGDVPKPSGARWPANIITDGSEDVLAAFPDAPGQQRSTGPKFERNANVYGKFAGVTAAEPRGDSGSAARYFYTSKADADDRLGSKHPTVKPLDLMQYLVRLVTPAGGLVLDPFAGTGTTAEAAWREGMSAVLIEREAEYQDDIRRRMKLCLAGPDERARESIKAKTKDKPVDAGPLFAREQQ